MVPSLNPVSTEKGRSSSASLYLRSFRRALSHALGNDRNGGPKEIYKQFSQDGLRSVHQRVQYSETGHQMIDTFYRTLIVFVSAFQTSPQCRSRQHRRQLLYNPAHLFV